LVLKKEIQMSNKIIERICKETGIEGLVETLSERLSPTDLQSLLIEVYRRRAEALAPRDVLHQYRHDRFVQPAQVGPIAQLDFDRLAYALLPPGFEGIELSPVAPLGTCSVVSSVSQNVVVPTIRNTDVCSDATNVLALECASRRRQILHRNARATDRAKLATSHRQLRAQRFEGPASFQHFAIFTLCTAGRDEGNFKFETEALLEQLDFYVRLLDKAGELGYTIAGVRVSVTALDEGRTDTLHTNVIDPLIAKHPNLETGFDQDRQSGRGYYTGVCFAIHAVSPAGDELLLVDGGLTTWTQQLLSNRKERLLTSGLGSERLCACFQQS
jgi:hypothetical protein